MQYTILYKIEEYVSVDVEANNAHEATEQAINIIEKIDFGKEVLEIEYEEHKIYTND